MKIAFALLADKKPQLVERLCNNLVSAGHMVALHYDQKSPDAQFEYLVRNLKGCDQVRFARRVRVRWGEWSIVAASLNCLETIQAAGWEPDYVYLASGMDYPIRPSAELVAFLERNRGKEFIESVPADGPNWVKTGPQKERYQYRFYFNWREQRYRFEVLFALQKFLGLKRKMARGMAPYIGSQWWVLSWDTLQKILQLAHQQDILGFFRTTLIPDELFFQTLVRDLVPESRVVSRTLTLYQFTDYGCPVVYHSDHFDFLMRQPFFMARKLSPHRTSLRDALDACWRGELQPRTFNDRDVGLIGPEYDDWRVTYREGAPGRPVAGRSYGRWYDDQDRLRIPFFAVIGTSSAELAVVHRALRRHPDLLCHGQLFHPKHLEFAADRTAFAGYMADDIDLRALSAPQFLADVVRMERRRMSGFMLRWGQGWHMPELMCDRPNVRVVVLSGDPLVSFCENALGTEPLLGVPFDGGALEAVPPEALANRFRRFLHDFRRHVDWLSKLAAKSAANKPKGWIVEIDLTAAVAKLPPRPAGGPGWCQAGGARTDLALASWRDCAAKLQACLGLGLDVDEAEQADELARLEERRQLVIERLIEGGITPTVLDLLQQGPDGPRSALALL